MRLTKQAVFVSKIFVRSQALLQLQLQQPKDLVPMPLLENVWNSQYSGILCGHNSICYCIYSIQSSIVIFFGGFL